MKDGIRKTTEQIIIDLNYSIDSIIKDVSLNKFDDLNCNISNINHLLKIVMMKDNIFEHTACIVNINERIKKVIIDADCTKSKALEKIKNIKKGTKAICTYTNNIQS